MHQGLPVSSPRVVSPCHQAQHHRVHLVAAVPTQLYIMQEGARVGPLFALTVEWAKVGPWEMRAMPVTEQLLAQTYSTLTAICSG